MVTAIVLAAGLSSRMGKQNKLLLPFAGLTVIETVIQNLISANLYEILVVTGHEADAVKGVLEQMPVKIIYNPDYAKGMTTSIQLGVSKANGTGYMICLADMPLIQPQEYAFIKDSYTELRSINEKCICIPVFKNKKGNPVIFSSVYKQLIFQHKDMEGCKQIIQSNEENVFSVEVNSESFLKDMDTIEVYEAMTRVSNHQRRSCIQI